MTPSLRRSLLLAFSLALVSFPSARAAEPAPASLAWWQEAKLGLFLHWGIYSLAAGEWRGRENSTIPPWEGKNFSEFLMPNRMIGDAALPEEKRYTLSTWQPFKSDTPLLKSGLIGPVRFETADPAD